MQNNVGKIGWIDLTTENAEEIRDFYSKVTGWKFNNISMGDYNDYVMLSPNNEPVSGICHKLGSNKDLPNQWLIYITVENLEQSLEECLKLGGKIISGPKNYGNTAKYCIIEDPSGAVAALYSENITN
ncbi:MAG: VOC family protein [Melioribacteraceae bacterium]